MTLIWLLVWFISSRTGAHQPLLVDPVNVWTATLILAIGLDLAATHARNARRR